MPLSPNATKWNLLYRAEANGGLGVEGPPGDHLSENFALLSKLCFGGFCGEIMHKNMDLLMLKDKFQKKLLNLPHIFD